MMCGACKEMIDQPPFREPHGALSRVSVIATQAGELVLFRCVACATRLQRILPKGKVRVTELHHWTMA